MSGTTLLFKGQRELQAGNAAAALAALERATASMPRSPHVALHRALAIAEAGCLEEALGALKLAAQRWPRNPVFPLFRGALLAEADRLNEAAEALEAAFRLSPGNRLAEAYLALIAIRRGELERPLRRLAVVGLTDNPRALAALLTEVEAELFRRFGPDTDGWPPRHAEAEPPPRLRRASAERLIALGRTHLERGDPAAAMPLLKLAAEKNPSLPDIYALLGFATYDLGRYEEALDYLARAGSWAKAIEAVHLHRGACLYKLGRFTEALGALQAAQEADKLGDYTAWIQLFLARTLIALGRPHEARPHLRRLIEAEGGLALARLRQARELLGLAAPATAPQGYEVIQDGNTVAVVKPAYAQALRERRPAPSGGPLRTGRAPMERIALPDGGAALIRSCRRGGPLGRLLGDKHLDGNRFLREIAVSDALRRRGLPTPEIIAGIRREVFPGIYRAEIVVREIPDSLDLAAALRAWNKRDDGGTGVVPVGGTGKAPLPSEPPHDRRARVAGTTPRAALLAAADLIRRLHDAGLYHPDLNARNILLCPDGSAMIIDLDRAELLDELPVGDRIAILARLYRSLHKLGLAPDPVSDAEWAGFYAAYAGDDATFRGLAGTVMSRCRRDLRRHRLWWRLLR